MDRPPALLYESTRSDFALRQALTAVSSPRPSDTSPIRAAEFSTAVVVASAFAVEEISPGSALRFILATLNEVYDGEPVSLPGGVPSEIPSVIVSSRDGSSAVEVARSRVNFRWSRAGGDEGLASIAEVLRTFSARLSSIFDDQRARIGRLGSIVVRSTGRSLPGITLARQFCRPELLSAPLNRPEGFELHAHKQFALLPGLNVNSWMRIKTAKQVMGEAYGSVVAEQDLNTLAEELQAHNFSPAEANEFFSAAAQEFDTILGLYFPSGARGN